MILSAAYALWLYRRVVLGDLIKESLKTITDMTRRERAIFAPLVVMTLLLGVYPSARHRHHRPVREAARVSNHETALLDAGAALPGGAPRRGECHDPADLPSSCPRSSWRSTRWRRSGRGLHGQGRLASALVWATVGGDGGAALWIGLSTTPEGTRIGLRRHVHRRRLRALRQGDDPAVGRGRAGDERKLHGRRDLLRFEYPVLIALAVVGMMVMVSAGDLIALYMGLELQSLALYVVASRCGATA